MNKMWMLSLALLASVLATGPVAAQERPYDDGTVWTIGFAKVKPGMFDQYMRELAATYKPTMEEARKQGLILSYKILSGDSANRDDFNVLFLTEYKNWAAFDGLDKKFDAIEKKIVGPEEKVQQMMIKRSDIRELLGDKNMQEVLLK